MRAQVPDDRSVAAEALLQGGGILGVGEELESGPLEDRRLGRKHPGLLERGGQLARRDLARLHVRLIERIDADDRAGHRRGHLPAEEFLADVVDVGDRDAHHRMSRALQCVDGGVLRRIGTGRSSRR